MERLIVKNFAGIKEAELEFKDITVLIGPQAEGKSVIAKLMYVMMEMIQLKVLYKIQSIVRNRTKGKFDFFKNNEWILEFYKIFPKDFIIPRTRNRTSYIIFQMDRNRNISRSIKSKILLRKNSQEFVISNIDPIAHEMADRIISASTKFFEHNVAINIVDVIYKFLFYKQYPIQIFVPANRSIYALVKNLPIVWKSSSLDPVFIDFGMTYEFIKSNWLKKLKNKYKKIIIEFLGGDIVRRDDSEIIKHYDGRQVDILFASSGQKELLPLILTLLWVREQLFPKIFLYIEEPEAHLFPETQKKLVDLIAEVYNALEGRLRLVITTHSPYILTALNNLLYAGYIRDKFKARKDVAAKLEKVLRRQENIPSLGSRIISPSKVAVYEVKRSGTRSILDENGLISDSYMDEIADELHREEEELYDIKWEVERGSERYLEQ